jgi:hypothetical protein
VEGYACCCIFLLGKRLLLQIGSSLVSNTLGEGWFNVRVGGVCICSSQAFYNRISALFCTSILCFSSCVFFSDIFSTGCAAAAAAAAASSPSYPAPHLLPSFQK